MGRKGREGGLRDGGRGLGEWDGYGSVRASGRWDVSGLRDGVEAAKGVTVGEEGQDLR